MEVSTIAPHNFEVSETVYLNGLQMECIGYKHVFRSAATNSISVTAGVNTTPTDVDYNGLTGHMTLTIPSHGLTTANSIGIATESITLSCDKDNFATNHSYPRTTDPVHGNTTIPIISATNDTITVDVGKSGIGYGTTILSLIHI